MTAVVELIGKGWKFPIKVNAKGGLSYSEGPERIQDAIWIVLSTSLGERLMRPDFGAGVHEYIFQSHSDVMRTRLHSAVNEALLKLKENGIYDQLYTKWFGGAT